MQSTRTLVIALVVALSPLTAVGQGLYVESSNSSGGGVEKFWYMPHMFRSTDGGTITIIRLDREVLYNIDPEAKTYSELHFADMKGMKDRVASMLKKRMESMPPEQRKALEGRMSGATAPPTPKYEVVNTGETKSISGFTCTRYTVKRSGGSTETVWATNDVRGAESLRKDMEQFMEKVSSTFGSGKMAHEWYKEIRGFPIRTESDGSTRTVTKIEQRSTSTSEFDPPAGYTRSKTRGLEDLDQDKKH
jgi:hypothetical protein